MEDRAGISVTRWLLQNKISAFHEEKIFINYTHTDGMRPANCYAWSKRYARRASTLRTGIAGNQLNLAIHGITGG